MKTLNFKLNKRIKTFTNPSKDISGACWSAGSVNGNSYSGRVTCSSRNNYNRLIYGVHLEKQKGKMVLSSSKGDTQKKVWQPTQWIRTVTEIPLELFAMLPKGSQFIQHKHYWEIITAK